MSEGMEIDIDTLREKQENINEVTEHLSQISSIGNSTILIEKIKIIVALSKQLLEGFDDVTIVKTTSNLTLLVSNSKIIAADPTSVTPDAIKNLTRSRDKLLNQLLEMGAVLEQNIAAQTHSTLHGIGADSESNSKDKEKEQLELLAKYRGDLKAKKDVQQAFIVEGDPATMLEEVVSEFLDCTKNLSKSYEPGSIPSRCEILCSLCGIASSVLRLLDLVDSLFVSKFPMRKQVYSFTEKLLELGMAYKPVEVKGGREGDAIRDMRKQLPALNNSAKVMFEQLEERVRNLTASRQKSMKRKQNLAMLDSLEVDAMAASDFHENKPRFQMFRIICHVCCTSAKQASNGEPIKRGSVLRLEVSGDANIRELKEQLSVYTGIPVKYVLPRFPGIEQPPDNEIELGELFGGGDMKDVFLFDLSSSEGLPEDEYRELRRLAVAQMSIDSYDWDTEWEGDIAQATVDYDVTEPGHLSFIEGELLRVLKKNPDGWWKGEVNGVTGIFYKTFVVELLRDSPRGVPTNFKQVSFQGKPKQSFLLRKRSDETILSSPAQKKKFSYLGKFDACEKIRTPELKKKASHFSISLDSPTESDRSPPNQDVEVSKNSSVELTPNSEQISSCVRDKDFSERKLSNRVNSVNIDELIDQLSEYSGISVPDTTTTSSPTPSRTIPSVTNLGFVLESPVSASPKDAVCIKGSEPLSAVNPILKRNELEADLYDSIEGIVNTTGIDDTSELDTEENPLYEKVTSIDNSIGSESQELDKSSTLSSEPRSPNDAESRPPVPTSTRPSKPPPVAKGNSRSSALRFRLGGGKSDKIEKEKDKVKTPTKPKRQLFGRRQKSTTADSVLEDTHISSDSPLPPVPPAEALTVSNNSSTNNSNDSDVGIYSVLNPPSQSDADIYEEVDKKFKSLASQDFIVPIPTTSSTKPARYSHYEEVDLPTSNHYDAPQFTGSVDDLYSKVDFDQKSFRKIVSMEECVASGDEVDESETKSSDSTDAELTSSCHIYSLVTRKRDSILLQNDSSDEPVSVAISPKQETVINWDETPLEKEPEPKTRPTLPPKTLSIEDVEIYIKDSDIEVEQVARSQMDKLIPSYSPEHKKRVSHYQDISEPQSPPVPTCLLSEDDMYEQVTERPRAFSQPHTSPTKNPLEISHSAEYRKPLRVTDEINNTPLPPIPVDTAHTMDDDISQYESIESIMASKIPNDYKDHIQDLIGRPATVDVKSQYLDALLTCISNLLQLHNTPIPHVLFTRDNALQTKKLLKSLEMGQPLDVDFRTLPSILASLIRVILKSDKLGPIFPSSSTEQLYVLIKSDKESAISAEIHCIEPRLNKFIRDFIYLLNINFTCLNEKKKQEFILALAPLFFEDTSKKNIDTCRHILRYLIEHYSNIFKQ